MLFGRETQPSATTLFKSRLGVFGMLTLLFVVTDSASGADVAAVRKLFIKGDYAQVTQAATAAAAEDSRTEDWPILLVQALMAVGQYTNAEAVLNRALEEMPYSIRYRVLAYDVFRANGHSARAQGMIEEVNQLASRRDWAYRDPPNRLALGKAALALGADPKKVLDLFFDPVKKANPNERDSYLESGQLALDKNDFKLAGKVFTEAVKQFPDDADMHFGLAQAFASSDSEVTDEALETALKLNTNHLGARLLRSDNHIDSEEYEEAEEELAAAFKVNPHHPDAWALRAVLAHLRADDPGERNARNAALKFWLTNPAVDNLIGRKLSQKYRFAEGAAYQRRALKFDPDYLPAKRQLAQDLLRLGEEAEGWKLAETVNEQDPYDVLAYNLITLKDNLAKFRTLTNEHFLVRMEAREAAIYGERVLGLLERARQKLCDKYDLQLASRVTVEIFPEQKDFAIRTFGMPGGSGFLGVCFGSVITANSPATRPDSTANWEAILWHEFCHVVTLQLTRNKMPRWLSEGISVYEERQAKSAWGEQMSPVYRAMILGDDLTPVGELSAAFLSPKSPRHLQFAYFESSLVVEYLIGKYGLDSLKKILRALANGVEINQAIEANAAPLKKLEEEFAALTRERARKLGPGLDWEKPKPKELATEEGLQHWLAKEPPNFFALTQEARNLLTAKKWAAAEKVAQKLLELCPENTGSDNAYLLLARAYRGLDETAKERAILAKLAELSADATEAYQRLMELAAAKQDWAAVGENAARYLAVNPLVPPPHRFEAQAMEALKQPQQAIGAYRTLLLLEPPEAAEVHYRLARLLHEAGDTEAKRHVLMALEEAPRFRDAHKLLLQINGANVPGVKSSAKP